LLFHFVLTNAGSGIGAEGVCKLSEALKSNSSLTVLDLSGMEQCFISFSLNAGNNIAAEGAISLSEALKSNSSLTTLYLTSNILVASFHSHPIQIITLAMKEPSNYLKRSNQIALSQCSISAVRELLLPFSFSLNTGNNIGNKGAIKLSEALKSNSMLTSLNLWGNSRVAFIPSHSIQTTVSMINCSNKSTEM
jgi:hypothetical protein